MTLQHDRDPPRDLFIRTSQRLLEGRRHVRREPAVRVAHPFCSHLAMRGAPARAIQELAGHADLSTTQRYMHLSPGATEEAIRLVDGRQAGLELLENSGDIILDTLASTRIGVAGGVGAPLSIAAVADMPR